MSSVASHVYLVSARDWSADEVLQDRARAAQNVDALRFHRPLEIHGSERVEGVTVQDQTSGNQSKLDVDAVFIEIGLYPNSEFAIDLIETNATGEIRVDARGRTGVQGVFAAGDVTESSAKQVVVAAGEGAKAALSAFDYLITQV